MDLRSRAMEGMARMTPLRRHYGDKTVLLTGHTGFKGSWMSEWLLSLGARVVGVGLEPTGDPMIFNQLGLEGRLAHHILDIREGEKLTDLVRETQPDVVFHFAAQALVRYSYDHPIETLETNVMGTAHLLEALRSVKKPCQAVIVTSDKCYENREQEAPYTEADPMGGHDPYSASKGAAELVVASYRRSFFAPERYGRSHRVAVASARAGNVIGGGDWATDRIVPDCMRSLTAGRPVPVRNPEATRPWQHVLDPLGGYLLLGLRLATVPPEARTALCSGFNFGPDPAANRPVRELVEKILACWPGEWIDQSDPGAVHEARLLRLATDKAARLLNWSPVWGFETAVERTVEWYRRVEADPACAPELTRRQITMYMEVFENEI